MLVNTFCACYNFLYTTNCLLFSSLQVVHYILPLIFNIYLVSNVLFYVFKLNKPSRKAVEEVLGVDPKSVEAKVSPEKVVNFIAHRGLDLDVPENSITAFKYCRDQGCMFVELDVRLCADECICLHDHTLTRLAHQPISVRTADYKTLRSFDISLLHPEGKTYSPVRVCKLEDAVDFLLHNKMKMIIDVKDSDQKMVLKLLDMFSRKTAMYSNACVACFHPFVLYQLRCRDPRIVGVLIYRPHMLYATSFDAENKALNPRYKSVWARLGCRIADKVYAQFWTPAALLCGVSAVMLHKDIVSLETFHWWRNRNVRVIGWCVNRPLEKLYWRGVLGAPYITSTIIGEPKSSQPNSVVTVPPCTPMDTSPPPTTATPPPMVARKSRDICCQNRDRSPILKSNLKNS